MKKVIYCNYDGSEKEFENEEQVKEFFDSIPYAEVNNWYLHPDCIVIPEIHLTKETLRKIRRREIREKLEYERTWYN